MLPHARFQRRVISLLSRVLRDCLCTTVTTADFAGAPFVFMHHDAYRLSLKPPYNNPFRVPEAGDKSFMLDVGRRKERVKLDRLKPAHMVAGEAVFPSQIRPPSRL